jgi:type II secretory pathway pseudopilin PulG
MRLAKLISVPRAAGFSLIEVSVIILVVSILLTSLAGLSPVKESTDTFTDNKTNLDVIEKAIQVFYRQNGYIPCPADPTLAISNASFGLSTSCSGATGGTTDVGAATVDQVRMGSVPTRTLSISDKYMFDAWNNRIKYVVIKELAKSSALFSGYTTATSKVISIVDGSSLAGVSITEANPQQVGYILISHGKDGAGAYNYSGGGPNLACVAGNRDTYNCASLNTSSTTPYIFRDQTADPTAGANYFDDIIKWRTISNIKTSSILPATSKPTVGVAALKVGKLDNSNSVDYTPPTGSFIDKAGCGSNCFTNISGLTIRGSSTPYNEAAIPATLPPGVTISGGNSILAPAGRYTIRMTVPFCGTQQASGLIYYDGVPIIQLGRHFPTHALQNLGNNIHRCSRSTAIAYFMHDGVTPIRFRAYMNNLTPNAGVYHFGTNYGRSSTYGTYSQSSGYHQEFIGIEIWQMD